MEYMTAKSFWSSWDWNALRSDGISASVIMASGGVSGRDKVIAGV